MERGNTLKEGSEVKDADQLDLLATWSIVAAPGCLPYMKTPEGYWASHRPLRDSQHLFSEAKDSPSGKIIVLRLGA